MKRIYIALSLMAFSCSNLWAQTAPQQASSHCEWLRKMMGWPDHTCVCQEDSKTFDFPLDTRITETVWYNAKLKDVKQGITAYLYADCEVNIDVYLTCVNSSPAYSYQLSPNQTRDIDSDKIEDKLASAGVTDISENTPVYFKIYPVNGTGGRVICMPYNQGYHSTCSDCLAIFPTMTIVSSHADDVFYLDPAYIPTTKGLAVRWSEPNGAVCGLKITRGTCDGEVLAEAEIVTEEQPYQIDFHLLQRVREAGERLYLHFSHDVSAVGRIRLDKYTPAPTAVDNLHTATEAQLILDNGVIYILRGNQRYTILGNQL